MVMLAKAVQLLSATGLNEEADQSLEAFSKKLQAETMKAGCNATGACPIQKTPSSPAGAASSSPVPTTPSTDTLKQEQEQ